MIGWNHARLEVNGQMELTYFAGDDRFQLESPLEFAEGTYRKITKRRGSVTSPSNILQYMVMVVVALIYVFIPGMSRKLSDHNNLWPDSTQPSIFSGDSNFFVFTNTIFIINIISTFFAVIIVLHSLKLSFGIHSAQAKALELLGICSDSREAMPEPLLSYYVDLSYPHYLNLDCWMYARDRLRLRHKQTDAQITAFVAPVLLVDLIVMVVVMIRILTKEANSIAGTFLGVWHVAVTSYYLVGIIFAMVNSNNALRIQHMQKLEQYRERNAEELQECVQLAGNMRKKQRSSGFKSKPGLGRRRSSLRRVVSLPGQSENELSDDDDDEETEVVKKKERDNNVGSGFNKPKQTLEDLEQKIQELEVYNLILESQMSKVETLDEPIQLLGLVVDQGFVVTAGSALAAGASTGIGALFDSLQTDE